MRKHRKVTVNGVTLPLPAWAKAMDITIGAINRRVHVMGWSWEKAVSTPRMVRRYVPGMKFGEWTLIRDTGKLTANKLHRCHIWEVQCDCGFQIEYPIVRFSPCMDWRLPRCSKCGFKTITARGKTQTITQWAKETGTSYATIYCRLRLNWTEEEAVFGKPKK